jgi:hypothetical protein
LKPSSRRTSQSRTTNPAYRDGWFDELRVCLIQESFIRFLSREPNIESKKKGEGIKNSFPLKFVERLAWD